MMCDTCGVPVERLDPDPPLRSASTNCSSSGGWPSISDSITRAHQRRLTRTGRPGHDPVRAVAALVQVLHVQEQQLAVVGAVAERNPQAVRRS